MLTGHKILLLLFLSGWAAIAPSQSSASGQIELQLGSRFTHRLSPGPLHPIEPALSLEGSLLPGRWPVGVAGYASAAADWYDGVTLSYPGFNDWLSAHYRVIAGELGGGLKKAWHV